MSLLTQQNNSSGAGQYYCGGISISGAVETVIAAIDAPVKAAGTTALSSVNVGFDMPENNRLRFVGSDDVCGICSIGITITAASSNEETTMYIAKNGEVIGSSAAERKIGTGGDKGRAAVGSPVALSYGDYLEAWIANNTGTANITYEKMNLSFSGAAV